ncbi:hypothetical protein [Aeromicrobium sp. CnD17-E]|uniref:hypothetical protein n=1 Tax=Aeromicrobium sp. CnD17-E TaxID=2954487 RepID=UPI002097E2F1|nr:hypothetical protein [Aeromicrobium sp. CnD17-E]MCO7239085.1 hypothetical protein [Aeromicrobium sp. CnD17-E]
MTFSSVSDDLSFSRNAYPQLLAPGRWMAALVGLGVFLIYCCGSSKVVSIAALFVLVGGWIVTLAVTTFLPVPQPVSTMNAFAARSTWLLRAVVGALMIGVTATYGALVGIDVEKSWDEHATIAADVFNEVLFTPLVVALVLLLWFAGMWLSVDLCRAREAGRRQAIERLVDAATGQLALKVHVPKIPDAVRAWVADAIGCTVRPGAALFFGYFGPVVSYYLGYELITSGSATLW